MNGLTDQTIVYHRYTGRSMWPCFQEGDILLVAPVRPTFLRPGDCIVFRGDNDVREIVHRVVAVTPAIVTRGDARGAIDDKPVAPEMVAGMVVARVRYGREVPVARGFKGVVAGCFFRYAGRLDPARPAKGGTVARCIQRMSKVVMPVISWRLRVVRFTSGGNVERDYVQFGTMIIGVRIPDQQSYAFAWPYSLFFTPPDIGPGDCLR
jgi:signal peptidase I